ncbi:5-formyltetrahydrofolate cyclo-ligase [Virgibacillus dakarensis]|uniref:5-formyltetrahydrofolate cyclo-ligase n=1 Tax=Lentibacillus populi TaxID=1827502 RepID=A0A9W5TUB3_9BACI|nr:5-formyltetrahydrofolate cyclo-ligase [Lentibacillus populi]MTW84066.1 5-formyltetrahydrofolate cyclo-ligase [Virgibacillus dakarensis]GGB29321.1 hypothetical protein GCM10011409_03360 [Lentibacillus populi]
MNKPELRQSIITYLKQLSTVEKQTIEKKLASYLITLDTWKQAKTVGITISQQLEWDTKPIIETAWEEGKTVCVPKCLPKEKKLIFYEFYTYNQLETVYYHLLEPKPDESIEVEKDNIDLLLVPGLLFDKKGYRIGFGGGYYDRFLSDFPNQTVSITSERQVVDQLPKESFDIPVSRILTENGLANQGDLL